MPPPPDPPRRCAACASELGPGLLACPGCRRLVHAARLAELAQSADARRGAGDAAGELAAWREALDLLPPGSRQETQLRERVARLAEQASAGGGRGAAGAAGDAPSRRRGSGWIGGGGALAAIGLLAWKLKGLAAFALTKAKFLVLGLGKASTLLTMVASLGVYWAAWGWKFALGLVLSLYVHEMGHVWELRRRGFPASAPMFVPGLGAVVRLKQRPASAVEDARIGLAGPIWGLGAALACALAWLATDHALLGATARVGAWINLFNLIPVWQLDGSRGFAPLSRVQRMLAAGAVIAAFLLSGEGMLLLVALVAAARCFTRDAPATGDGVALVQYVGLVAALAALCHLPVATP